MEDTFRSGAFYKKTEAYMESESVASYEKVKVKETDKKKVRSRKRKSEQLDEPVKPSEVGEKMVTNEPSNPSKGDEQMVTNEASNPSEGDEKTVTNEPSKTSEVNEKMVTNEPQGKVSSWIPKPPAAHDEATNTVTETTEKKVEEVVVYTDQLEEQLHENMTREDIKMFLCKKYNKKSFEEVVFAKLITKEESKLFWASFSRS